MNPTPHHPKVAPYALTATNNLKITTSGPKATKENNHKKQKVVCLDTKEVYNSITEAAEFVGVEEAVLKRRIIDCKPINGRYWRFVLPECEQLLQQT